LSTLHASLLHPDSGGYQGLGSMAIVDPRATVPVAIPLTLGNLINVAVRHTSLRAAWLMMTVPLLTGEKGAAQSLIRAEAQVVTRAHPRTPPRRSTAKKSVSSFHTW
jgi:hypothetical protein